MVRCVAASLLGGSAQGREAGGLQQAVLSLGCVGRKDMSGQAPCAPLRSSPLHVCTMWFCVLVYGFSFVLLLFQDLKKKKKLEAQQEQVV